MELSRNQLTINVSQEKITLNNPRIHHPRGVNFQPQEVFPLRGEIHEISALKLVILVP